MLRLLTALFGTKRRSSNVRPTSAFGGEADLKSALPGPQLETLSGRAPQNVAQLVAPSWGRSSSDGRALQISPNDQRTGICRLEFGNGGIEIVHSEVTDDQSSDVRLLRDAPHDRRRRMQRIRRGAGGDREVHDEDIGILSEIHEFRIGAVLIGTEHDRPVTRFNTIREGGHVRMGIPNAVTFRPSPSNTADGSAFSTSTTLTFSGTPAPFAAPSARPIT